MKEIIGLNIIGLIINNIIPIKNPIAFFGKRIKNNSRTIGMIISIMTLYIILYKILIFNTNNNEYQDRFEFLGYNLGLDGVGLGLIGLIGVIEPILIILIKGEKREEEERKRIVNNLIIVKILITILFSSLDLLIFFITFELLLIPMFILISRYGSKYKYFIPRLEAGIRFFMYTMIGSLLMLISIIILYIKFGTTSNELINLKINSFSSLPSIEEIRILQIVWIFLFFSFLIKIPMFPFHTWLPLAHSDAPTIGSIILAALLLKLGTFGIIRYSLYIFDINPIFNLESINIYNIFLPIIYILALLSIYYSSILSIRALFDFKKIIAYSSIIHMNFSIFGLFSKNLIGLIGSSFLMFTHAFISSGLFLLIGILYKRYHSRFILYYQGLSYSLPLFSSFFLLFTFANISLPFCSSFLSEFFILVSSYHSNPFISLLLALSLIFSSSFAMWFAIRLLFGSISPYIQPLKFNSNISNISNHLTSLEKETKYIYGGYKDLSFNEFITLSPLLFFTIFFTFFPKPFISFFTFPLVLFV